LDVEVEEAEVVEEEEVDVEVEEEADHQEVLKKKVLGSLSPSSVALLLTR